VTGSAIGNAQRPLSVAVDVVDRRQFEQQSSGALSSSFDGNVAGLWLWEQSPTTLLARYGSIRGASSFGVSYPKVYIDGIEVANPLLVTELNPASLDRVEVIRGPQGAALYGADAISGVVNIVTRHEGLQSGASRTELVSRAGLSQTAFADRSVLAQNHSLSWRTGSNIRSGTLGVNVTTLGGYVPEAYSRDVKLNGGFRIVSSAASVTGTGRVYAKQAALGQNPLIIGFLPSSMGPSSSGSELRRNVAYENRLDSLREIALGDSAAQSVNQYTVGITSTLLSGTTWVPSFSAGVDGYRLKNVANELGIIPSALDSALHSAEGGADRVTIRTSLVGQYDLAPRRALTLTFAAEHSRLQETLQQTTPATGSTPEHVQTVPGFRSNTGLVAQANVAMNEAVYLTGGARLERNHGYTADEQTVLLPTLGIATVRDLGRATLKARAAYGIGVRPARTTSGIRAPGPSQSLDPEKQRGLELGADLFVGRRFAAHLTRFDQTASGLIQNVAVPKDTGGGTSGPGPSKRIGYVLQNVGEIGNRGWEIESTFALRYFTLGGAFTTVDSRVERIARSYTGDLRPGDRMLGVPAGTASLTASSHFMGWKTGLTASRAYDWVNYDRLRIAKDYASCGSCTAENITGAKLRSYWLQYDGVTRLRASASRELPRGLGLRLTVDNLTNAQRGEPDNITVLPGRTVLFGMSARIP
jgi:iron complex outermembrane recepter protein